jgi:hypothetical protein
MLLMMNNFSPIDATVVGVVWPEWQPLFISPRVACLALLSPLLFPELKPFFLIPLSQPEPVATRLAGFFGNHSFIRGEVAYA